MEIRDCERLSGKGLYSTKNYNVGEIIFILEGEIFDYPTKHTIHIGDNKHIIDKFGFYMNHSFNPTTRIDGKNVVALVDIKEGDEINFNYNDSELNMATPFYDNGVYVSGNNSNL